jgi:outer membrane biogenesis lipoprotein LolB
LTSLKGRVAVLMMILLLPACHKMVGREPGFAFPDAPQNVQQVLSVIKAGNDTARSFKGIGKISVWDENGSRTSRAAWAGAIDGRLRIEFLALPGQMVAKFIYDGENYYFMSQADRELHQRACSDPVLTQVTGVPIRVSEVVDFLAGGIPIYDHDSVDLEPLASSGGYALVFKKRWLGVVQKIYLDSSRLAVLKVEIYKWWKKVYQVTFEEVRPVNGRHIPFDLAISNGKDQGFRIVTDRYWADALVTPSMFSWETGN